MYKRTHAAHLRNEHTNKHIAAGALLAALFIPSFEFYAQSDVFCGVFYFVSYHQGEKRERIGKIEYVRHMQLTVILTVTVTLQYRRA